MLGAHYVPSTGETLQVTSGDFKWGVMKAEVHCKEGKNVTSCIPRVQCNLKIIGAEDMLVW